jgi:outer membrane protein assembly factor BamB
MHPTPIEFDDEQHEPRWTTHPGAGEPGCEPSPDAPLVVDGRVYMVDGGGVAAYNARTGVRLWLNTSFSVITAHLVVAGGLVLVSDTSCYSNSDYDGNVTALNAATGVEQWRSTGSWIIDKVVADAGAIVTSGYCGTCDGFEHGVEAYHLSDGSRLWSHENEVLAGHVSARGRILLACTSRAETYAATIGTGTMIWSLGRTAAAVAATPAGDQLYLTNTAGLTAVDAGTGRQRWRIGKETGDLAADGRRIYVASAGRINTYDARNGRLLWTRALTNPSTPIRAGGLLYTIYGTGTLAVLSPTTGAPIRARMSLQGLTDHVVPASGQLFIIQGSIVTAYAP